jgi:hypothetical protein
VPAVYRPTCNHRHAHPVVIQRNTFVLKPNKQCLVCQLVQADKKLERRINLSKQFVPGGEAIQEIWRDYADQVKNPRSFYVHAKSHQAPNKIELEKRASAHATKNEYREIVTESQATEVSVVRHYSEDLQELKQIGMEAVRSGDAKMTASVLAKLIDLEAKIEDKAKDRNLEMMKMFAYFASGSAK